MNQYGDESYINEIDRVGKGEPFDGARTGSGNETFNHLKTAVSNSVRNAAASLGRASDQIEPPNAGLSRAGTQTADWLNRSADYIEEFEPQQAIDNLKQEVRQNPGRSLLIAGAAGLILGALFRRR